MGTLCEIDYDECNSSPCFGQATCITTKAQPNFYQCLCPPGFEGVNCQLLRNPCLSIPCKNNAQCINLSTFGNPLTYICQCQLGWTGSTCEIKNTPCSIRNQCSNGGTCNDTSAITFTCICPKEYTGKQCETRIDACISSPCQNGGVCVAVGTNLQVAVW